MTYQLQLKHKEDWVTLKNYTGLSRIKAEFLYLLQFDGREGESTEDNTRVWNHH